MQVLIVDDSKVIRMLVAECISELKHEVMHMESGAHVCKILPPLN
jgi:CheY-like chemotaxis protein